MRATLPRRDPLPVRKRNWRREEKTAEGYRRRCIFPLKSWPREMVLMFWKKPPGDRETFKLVLFLLGNGCSPDLIRRWIVLSQHWASSKAMAEKRCRQVDFVVNNEDTKSSSWFYYDIHNQSLLYLNGQCKV